MSMTINEVKTFLRSGEFTAMGGYPLFFITRGNDALSFDAVKQNWKEVCRAIQSGVNDYFEVLACAINYEDQDLYCDHTGRKIPSAYEE